MQGKSQTPSSPGMLSPRSVFIFAIPWVILAALGAFWLSGKIKLSDAGDRETVLITRVESMGKLELVKYHLKDVVEHKLVRQWLPDPSALLIVSGEVVGCIDLSHIERKNVHITRDSLSVTLPQPEICYTRVNHAESRVYSTQYAFWDEARLVDEAYRVAEQSLEQTARHSDILTQTRTNALGILSPLFKALGYRAVTINFK